MSQALVAADVPQSVVVARGPTYAGKDRPKPCVPDVAAVSAWTGARGR